MCLHIGKVILHEIHFLCLFIHSFPLVISKLQKQPLKAARWKSCFENMQMENRKILLPKCDFNRVALQVY